MKKCWYMDVIARGLVIPLTVEHNGNGDVETMEEQSPVEEVALIVPITDDPFLPVITFQMWTLESLYFAYVLQYFIFL